MCGIAGLLNNTDKDALTSMLQSMSSRGPDDSGILIDTNVNASLGHKRLSIIDLSSSGHQPMTNNTGRFSITFNGEIYNYKELRRELSQSGYSFQTHTDTEVLLYAYIEWGVKCLNRLRGMFAFAVLDRGLNRGRAKVGNDTIPDTPYLFLARDRFGIKPLLYTKTPFGFAFASELKALLSADIVERILRPEAVIEYLGYGAVSQPGTILKGVYQLEPGTAMYVYDGGTKTKTVRYWDLAQSTARKQETLSQMEYEEQVRLTRTLLEEATRYHLVSDVPVGAFLSGGVDSTAVCALMQRLSGKAVKTFSIGFKEDIREVTDETSFAKTAAEFIGCDHREVILENKDITDYFDSIIHALDQPSIDGTNTYLVSRAASQSVKVAISGLGGDELFAGYPHFRIFQKAAHQKAGVIDYASALLHRLRPNRFTQYQAYISASVPERLAFLRNIERHDRLKKQVVSALARHCIPYMHPVLRNAELPDRRDPLTQLSYAECRGYLPNTLLRDGDVMSMAHSLEVRPVLLDHVLAEHAFALPPESKIRGSIMKAVLVDAVRDIIPSECWSRPKTGFELPFASWMNGPLLPRVIDTLHSDSARQIFSSFYLKQLQKQAKNRTVPRKAWALFVLLSWMEQSKCVLS